MVEPPGQIVEIEAVAVPPSPNNGWSLYPDPLSTEVTGSEFVAETFHVTDALAGTEAGIVPSQIFPLPLVIAIGVCATPLNE